MAHQETMVRMGALAASASAADVLVTIGLGSCIGLVLLDSARGVAGLAHVMLPAAPAGGVGAAAARFADTAVPALVDEVLRLGARRHRLDAVLVGGAQMFTVGAAAMDVGARNRAGVHEALKAARLLVRAEETGGNTGRTVRVHVGTGVVRVKAAGGTEVDLLSPAAGSR